MSVLIYTTCKDAEEAKRISRELLDARLIACANIFPVESVYRWKGEIEESKETVMILKTSEDTCERAQKLLTDLHSYDLPAIEVIKAECSDACERWLKEETSPKRG
ncbi:MAG: divalent-cation tolerance protein CutA [archaeon]